ncbi:DUF4282 domain-containing protein [Actinoallomurus sp. NPDC050550]|uniref:DUF4282 domain-containing protein n=1 Tax=Actinoallomurus sp. NPDC050550 TaxID=3154937 RepID=UPI0033C8D5CB
MPQKSRKGFLAILTDLNFTSYLTAKLVRATYRVILVFTINATICALLFAWWLPSWLGGIAFLIFVLAPASGIIFLAITRIALEHIVVIYAIAEQVSTLTEHVTAQRKENKPQ